MENESTHPIVVTNKSYATNAGGHVPNLDRLIPGTGGEEWANTTRFLADTLVLVRIWRRCGRRRCCHCFLNCLSGRFGCPGDALHHVFVFPHFQFTFFGRHEPDADGLIVRTRGQYEPVGGDSNLQHPFPVPRQCLDAIPVQ